MVKEDDYYYWILYFYRGIKWIRIDFIFLYVLEVWGFIKDEGLVIEFNFDLFKVD